ncbi:MAG: hypothetical protein LBT59_30465 [Clostridiales bacterium]|jgi:hypothetical protein|nr:hypothetical protein [Clostridiales bacterium]
MGQKFFLSLYEDSTKKYGRIDFKLGKLGEIASNSKRKDWGHILNRPLRVGFIGDASARYYKRENEKDWENYNKDYGVASLLPAFESDCAGELELCKTKQDVGCTGYLINHTKQVYFDVSAYYEASWIGEFTLDPLPILTASGLAASLFWEGFSNGTAFSLLGSWFTDVIEWSKTRPADMDELKGLEFREIHPFDYYRIWGVTPDNYLADRNGQTFYSRNDIGLFFVVISPAKRKYLVTVDDKEISIQSELVPDPGVVLKYDVNSVSFFNEDGSKFEGFRPLWFGNAYILDRRGNKISCDEWLRSRP